MIAPRLCLVALGLVVAALIAPAPAHACSCMSPTTWVLPQMGSQDVPTTSRVFVLWHQDLGSYRLMKSDAEVPVDRVAGPAPTDWPAARYLWLVPRLPLEASTAYRVEFVLAYDGSATTLSEFATAGGAVAAAVDLLRDATASLAYWAGRRNNTGGDCGGINAVRIQWSTFPGSQGVPWDPVVDVYLWKQGDAVPSSPVLEVPEAAYPMGLEVGWVDACDSGLRLPLEECAVYCAAVQARDLEGNAGVMLQAGCVQLSWLTPDTSETPASCAVPGDAMDSGDVPVVLDVGADGAADPDAVDVADASPGADTQVAAPARSSGCQAGTGPAGNSAFAVFVAGLVLLMRRRLQRCVRIP